MTTVVASGEMVYWDCDVRAVYLQQTMLPRRGKEPGEKASEVLLDINVTSYKKVFYGTKMNEAVPQMWNDEG